MNQQENQEDNEEREWMMDWDRRRRAAAAQVLCYVVYTLKLHHVYHTKQNVDHSATSSKGKKRKAPGNDDSYQREFESIGRAISSVANAIREGNIIAKRGRARVYAEEEVFAALVKLGVNDKLRYRAYTFLTQNPSRARAFFGCPVEERLNFLMQMMCGPCNL